MKHRLFLEAFLQLRDRGLVLGINEYLAFVDALAKGFGTGSREAFMAMCRALWAKSIEQQSIVDEIMQTLLPLPITETEIDEIWLDTNQIESKGKDSGLETSSEITLPIDTNSEHLNQESNPAPDFRVDIPVKSSKVVDTQVQDNTIGKVNDDVLTGDTENNIGGNVTLTWGKGIAEGKISEPSSIILPYNRSLSFSYELPVKEYDLIQLLRRYRRMERQGRLSELDIQATISQIYKDGVLLEPVFMRFRSNQAHYVVFVDTYGSMAPFKFFTNLFLSVVRDTSFVASKVFYFHDAPDEYLFSDENLNNGFHIDDIVSRLSNNKIIIFSDAGAARGKLDEKRVENTVNFIGKLRKTSLDIGWLNPVPHERWLNTSATQISERCSVPMFQFDQLGLVLLMEVLWGKTVAS